MCNAWWQSSLWLKEDCYSQTGTLLIPHSRTYKSHCDDSVVIGPYVVAIS